jgi:gamma-glutamylcyclotransferase
MFYFAYGSNLNWAQMRGRCPSASFMEVASLPNHRLAFTRYSSSRECGVADIVEAEGSNVWGVVYEIIDPAVVQRLDRCEGVPKGYTRNPITAFLRGTPERALSVDAYFAVKDPNPPLPNAEYKACIVEGAKFWQLPSAYIEELELIATA